MFQAETFVRGIVRNADPGDITLPDVLDARSAVDEVVYLSLEHRFEILLHLTTSYMDNNTHVHRSLWIDIGEIWADHIDLSISDIVQIGHLQVFETTRVLAPEFNAHIRFSDDFALEGRAVGDRYVYFRYLYFDAAHLDAFLHQEFGPF